MTVFSSIICKVCLSVGGNLDESFCLWDIWYLCYNDMFSMPGDVNQGHQQSLSVISVSFISHLSLIFHFTSLEALVWGIWSPSIVVSLRQWFGYYFDSDLQSHCDLKTCVSTNFHFIAYYLWTELRLSQNVAWCWMKFRAVCLDSDIPQTNQQTRNGNNQQRKRKLCLLLFILATSSKSWW